MDKEDIERKFDDLESKIYEQEHRLFPVWYNFLTRKKFSKQDNRRLAINKALLWSFIPKPTPTAVAITGISILTIFLAYQANVKLENQNTLLLVQNELQESQRRASLNIEISSIMQQINNERESSRLNSLKDENHQKKGHKVAPYTLSDITAARIASISRSLRPYRILKTDRVDSSANYIQEIFNWNWFNFNVKRIRVNDFLEENIRSPEREQLLVALLTMRISFSNIGLNSNFDYSRLENFDFSRSDLRTIRMSNSSLEGTHLSYTIFDEGVLRNTNFKEVYGTTLSFIGTDLTGSNFENTSINNTDFTNADLNMVNFSGANLIQCNFTSATLSSVNFSYANLSGIDFNKIENILKATDFKNALIENLQNFPDTVIDELKRRGAVDNYEMYQKELKKRHNNQ
ncbi:pentapeptide repeat-containing protein [Marivirga sp. S37H4]|uniref:Pentapeptide repeat-containing protein n=1 Tax=Marivirga aurantiaca TaxID=2802615 RepID=A0A934WYQ9_9BACT|nr:pentapeptide repeat-containing protein [Marivirga aurantiaca]MBK6265643.1 pentapeptide repeat-containing protein [Marivirga aurantiaca]